MLGLPLFFKLENRRVLLVGDTEAARAKLRLLLKTPAEILWLVDDELAARRDFSGVSTLKTAPGEVTASDVQGSALVYASTGDDKKDRAISKLCRSLQVPVNIVDRPDLSDFSTPAIVDRSPLVVAISTHGAAPVFSRRLRSMIERLLPEGIGHLVARSGRFRGRLQDILPNPSARRRFWDNLFDMADPQKLLGLSDDAFEDRLESLAEGARTDQGQGHVQLVGAGPGDPELLTLKALKALQRADVILYDALVSSAVLEYARRDAVMIDVGKVRGNHGVGQDRIHELMIRHARAGHHVVRLKGGDPLIFGRVGEEIEALRTHDIAYELVPGITALAGSAARVGIPLTHRDDASSLGLVTGQAKDGSSPSLRGLAGEGRTLAIYMGLGKASEITRSLLADGVRPDFPLMVIENGTRPDERSFHGHLADLPHLVKREAIESPALIILGTVTRFAQAQPAARSPVYHREQTRTLAFAGG